MGPKNKSQALFLNKAKWITRETKVVEKEKNDAKIKMEYECNVTPSPIDTRDYDIRNFEKALVLNPPSTFSLVKDLQGIRNQGRQGTCAAQTAACIKEWQEKMDYRFDRHFSPQFVYNNRPNHERRGMFGREVMSILRNVGIVEEKEYRYGKIEKKEDINKELYEKAKDHKIKSYARVRTINDVKKSLPINGPLYISFPVFHHGVDMWKRQYRDQKMRGGHAMAIVGYDETGFIIRNSWGESWGDKGMCTYKYEDFGCHWEIWTTVDEDTDRVFEEDTLCSGCTSMFTWGK